ncbi:SRPBCC family protein [Streptacidiphilus melanogenes]|uniref:SRPBCC family protein n=1 Tax=Streptacidiphilus melanogenes TaxID=411235 RepID=UPI0005A848E5|nr:SRPBCC family protein [Streptacidiphilus melanogenes]
MRLHHDMTVPAPADEVWRALGEIEDIAPCLPGAAVDHVDEGTVYGSMSFRVGPITVAYRGRAVLDERDDAHHRMVVHASGREQRGVGTAQATLIVEAHEQRPGSTEVDVDTELALTGRQAQFGRGVMADIGDRVIAEFADRLSQRLAANTAGAAALDAAADSVTRDGAAAEPAGATREVTAGARDAAARDAATHATSAEAQDVARAAAAAREVDRGEAGDPAGAVGAGAAPVPQAGSDEPLDLGPVITPMLWRATAFVAAAAAMTLLARLIRRRLTSDGAG